MKSLGCILGGARNQARMKYVFMCRKKKGLIVFSHEKRLKNHDG